MDDILKVYQETGSIRKTSVEFGISEQKAKKMLISKGAILSDRQLQIAQLQKSGLTNSEIAAKLKISNSAMNSYLPYAKCEYNATEKTVNAQRITKSRAKNK